jgi:hypothetical protein
MPDAGTLQQGAEKRMRASPSVSNLLGRKEEGQRQG